jgi:hypothetical protein
MSSLDNKILGGVGAASTLLVGSDIVRGEPLMANEIADDGSLRIIGFDQSPGLEIAEDLLIATAIGYAIKHFAGILDPIRGRLGSVLLASAIVLGSESAEAAEPRPVGDSNNAEALLILSLGIAVTGVLADAAQKRSNSNKTSQNRNTSSGVNLRSPREERLFKEGIEGGAYFRTGGDELAAMRPTKKR